MLRRADASCTSEDVPEEAPQDRCFLRSRWYRSTAHAKRQAACGLHPQSAATLFCLATRTYHCTSKCFIQSWRTYRDRGRAPSFGNGPGDDGATNRPAFTPGAASEGWVEVGHGRSYVPANDDVGFVLKYECVPCEVMPDGSVIELAAPNTLLTARVMPAPPPPRRNMVRIAPEVTDSGTFTVLTYNVLADIYATNEMYPYCPNWALHWSYRRQHLVKELAGYDADILTLQEVQSDHFEEWFAPELQKHGYTAVYKKKTAQVYTGTSYTIDGCATFFKKDRFTLIKKYEVEFNKAALSLSETLNASNKKKEALNRLMKDNVALIVVLEALEAKGTPAGKRQLLCVANTHIHANPELKDVKLWQVHTLLKGLEKIAASAEIPMVVCGDFNSVPGSAAHSLLASGRIDAAHPELATDPLGILRPPSKLCHQLPLVSAYSCYGKPESAQVDPSGVEVQRQRLDPNTHEPSFTNSTRDFTGTLDYLFFTCDSVEPLAMLELPTPEEVQENGHNMPNQRWSSDHVALKAEFRWLR